MTRAEADRAVWVVEPGGRKFEGSAAVNRTFEALGGGWAFLAALYRLPPVRWLEDIYYRRVARRRAWW